MATTCAQLELNIYRGKTKVLKVNADNTHPIKLEEQVLEEVEVFTYLGSVDADVRARIGKARAVFVQLKNIWSSKELSLKTGIRQFNTKVKSVLLYGSETWRTTVTTIKRVQTFINTCLRKILQIRWPDTYGRVPTRPQQTKRYRRNGDGWDIHCAKQHPTPQDNSSHGILVKMAT